MSSAKKPRLDGEEDDTDSSVRHVPVSIDKIHPYFASVNRAPCVGTLKASSVSLMSLGDHLLSLVVMVCL
jgi:hypothetical protein